MVRVDTSVNNINVYTVTTIPIVFVLAESTERQSLSVTDACKTLKKEDGSTLVTRTRVEKNHHPTRQNRRVKRDGVYGKNGTYPWCTSLNLSRSHNLVALDKVDFGHLADLVHGRLRKVAGIANEGAFVDMLEARARAQEWVERMRALQKVQVVVEVLARLRFQHDNVRVVDAAMGMLSSQKRCDAKRQALSAFEAGG